MTDREKAIKGLEKIAEFFKARGDMAVGDGKMLLLSWMRAAEDAIALLEAQEPIDGDTISRSALLAAYDAAHKGPPGGARKLIEEAPAVVLKAQVPRVLTLEEMEQAGKNGEAIYVETPNDGCFWALAYPGEEPPKDKPFNYPGGVRFNAVEVNGDICDGDFYGMTLPDGRVHFLAWRAWTSEPTDAQREATPWD